VSAPRSGRRGRAARGAADGPEQLRLAASPRVPSPRVPPPSVPPPPVAEPTVYTVADLVSACAATLEQGFGDVWVEGEVTNLSQPASGHIYFTLRDAQAQLQCACFRREARALRFRLEDGLKVRCHGRVSIYQGQGKFQLYVDRVEPAGLGAAALALEQLKRTLQAEGLFDEARKRPLPFWPRLVGLVTSPTGAAVRDLIRVTHRRAATRLVVAPTQVQGAEAPAQIVAALRAVARLPGIEVVVVARGGGPTEDLAAFNDEAVARAIAACPVPVISAVGHEVDVTIADLVADLRAATPSQAGERLVPVQAELEDALGGLETRLVRVTRRRCDDRRRELEHAWQRLATAGERRVTGARLQLQALDRRLQAAHPAQRLRRHRAALAALQQRLLRASPGTRLQPLHAELGRLTGRLRLVGGAALERRRRDFAAAVAALQALSPLAVLERGYSLTRGPDGAVLREARAVAVGDEVSVRLARGELGCRVENVRLEAVARSPSRRER
jgi:exodeoxyribonuclease VII large subunit